jgi:hypothetical protein
MMSNQHINDKFANTFWRIQKLAVYARHVPGANEIKLFSFITVDVAK